MTPFILLSSTHSNNYRDNKKIGSFKFCLLLKKFIIILILLQDQTYLVKLLRFVSISGVTKQFACS